MTEEKNCVLANCRDRYVSDGRVNFYVL